MTWQRRSVFVAMTVMALALASCAGHRTATPPPNGTIVGMLGAVGGPSTGFHRFSTGTVTLMGGHAHYSMRVTTTGSFRFSEPPGAYQVTGVSPEYGNGGATCGGDTVQVKPDRTITANVACQES